MSDSLSDIHGNSCEAVGLLICGISCPAANCDREYVDADVSTVKEPYPVVKKTTAMTAIVRRPFMSLNSIGLANRSAPAERIILVVTQPRQAASAYRPLAKVDILSASAPRPESMGGDGLQFHLRALMARAARSRWPHSRRTVCCCSDVGSRSRLDLGVDALMRRYLPNRRSWPQ